MARNGYESDKNRLCVIETAQFGDGSKAPALVDLTANYDNNVDAYIWNPDNQGLTFIGYKEGIAPIFNIDLKGNVRQVTDYAPHDYAEVCYCGNRLYALRHDWHCRTRMTNFLPSWATWVPSSRVG